MGLSDVVSAGTAGEVEGASQASGQVDAKTWARAQHAQAELDAWLARFVREHSGLSALVHAVVGREALCLIAACNLDESATTAVRTLARGDGIIGLAFERNAAISTCGSPARRGPRLTPAFTLLDRGARVALPVHDEFGEVRAVVTVEFADDRVLTDDELLALDQAAGSLPGDRTSAEA